MINVRDTPPLADAVTKLLRSLNSIGPGLFGVDKRQRCHGPEPSSRQMGQVKQPGTKWGLRSQDQTSKPQQATYKVGTRIQILGLDKLNKFTKSF